MSSPISGKKRGTHDAAAQLVLHGLSPDLSFPIMRRVFCCIQALGMVITRGERACSRVEMEQPASPGATGGCKQREDQESGADGDTCWRVPIKNAREPDLGHLKLIRAKPREADSRIQPGIGCREQNHGSPCHLIYRGAVPPQG